MSIFDTTEILWERAEETIAKECIESMMINFEQILAINNPKNIHPNDYIFINESGIIYLARVKCMYSDTMVVKIYKPSQTITELTIPIQCGVKISNIRKFMENYNNPQFPNCMGNRMQNLNSYLWQHNNGQLQLGDYVIFSNSSHLNPTYNPRLGKVVEIMARKRMNYNKQEIIYYIYIIGYYINGQKIKTNVSSDEMVKIFNPKEFINIYNNYELTR